MNCKKIIAVLSLAALISGSFAGCNGDGETTKNDASLTYWANMSGASAQTLTSYSEMLMYQEIEKATGVKVEFIHPVAGSTGSEAFNTLLASNDLPDMIEYSWSTYAGGPDAAIDDGVIIALDDYLKEYAPSYYEYVEGKYNEENNGLYKAQSVSDKGRHYGFRNLNIGNLRGFCGLVVRADLLEKWDMSVPETIDDWTVLFEKAKSEGYSKPFSIKAGFLTPSSPMNLFNTAYDVGKSFYLEDDKVVYGPFQKGFKEFVAQMAEWTKKGYIDRNFVTNSNTDLEGNMTQDGVSMSCFGYIGGLMGKLLPAMEERNPEYDLVACPYPVLNKGDKCEFQEVAAESNDPTIAITSACEDVESAMKWCDYIYSEEGNLLHTFGVEGDTYTVEEIDGETHYIYTDKILKPETVGANSVNASLYKFFRPANGPGLNQHPDYLNGYYPYQCQKDALVIWNENIEEARKHALPTLSYSDEESSKIAVLEQSLLANFDTAISEIMLGNKSIDEYDKLVRDLKANGYDEILKIRNAAYDRYKEKIK